MARLTTQQPCALVNTTRHSRAREVPSSRVSANAPLVGMNRRLCPRVAVRSLCQPLLEYCIIFFGQDDRMKGDYTRVHSGRSSFPAADFFVVSIGRYVG